ncbi:MAG: hypothetical protein M0T80_06265 [Actinomycetota bacterium]|nr:hypothetical protein [Actinomycetota bacterium]
MRGDQILGPLDGWMAQVFDPDDIDESLDALHTVSPSEMQR